MLTLLFKTFLGVGLSLSPFILLLHLTQSLFLKRYSPHLLHWVWFVIALRLLLPLSPPSGFSPLMLSSGSVIYYLDQDPSIAVRAFAEAASKVDLNGMASPSIQSGLSWISIGAMGWIMGASAVILFHLLGQIRLQREMRRWRISVCTPSTRALFEESKQHTGITKQLDLYTCMRITSPMLTGFFHPQILLPSTNIKSEQLQSIFYHELMHYKRNDLWYKLMLLGVLALHWYNPLVYLLVWQAENAMELACDSDVLQSQKITRKDYGLSILSQLKPVKATHMLLSTQFYGGKKYMKIRIKQIADTSCKKNGKITLLLCAAWIMVVSFTIGCRPLAADVAQTSNFDQTQSLTITTYNIPDDLTENTELAEEEIMPAESAADAQVELDAVFERIAANSKKQAYIGGLMAWPAPEATHIVTPYGWIVNGTNFHTGIDIAGKDVYGTPVIATQDGTIAYVSSAHIPGSGYGRYIILDHGGDIATLYAHMSEILVKEGDYVTKGQQIGKIGATGYATGPHLHFEVREQGKCVNPEDYLVSEEEK